MTREKHTHAMEDLHVQVDSLKKKLGEPNAKTHELLLEIENLKDSIHELNTIFRKALEEMKGEDSAKLLANMMERINAIQTQNETIARGMVAISDKVDEFVSRGPMRAPVQAVPQHTMGPPPMPGPRVAPRPTMDMPPPPPKKSLF